MLSFEGDSEEGEMREREKLARKRGKDRKGVRQREEEERMSEKTERSLKEGNVSCFLYFPYFLSLLL